MATARPKGRGYEIRVSMGYDMNGRKIVKSKIWIPPKNLTPKQLQKALEREKVLYEEQVKTGANPDCNIKFAQFVDMWVKDYGERFLAPKTLYRHFDYLKRINQAIGHIKLKDLQPIHLNAFYKNLAEEGVSMKRKRDENGNIIGDGKLATKTILEHHRTISTILSVAVKWGLITDNVARRADPPKPEGKEIEFLNESEIKELIKALRQEPIQYQTMVMIAIYTGMRRGELFGLEWKDIDFDNKTLSIIRTSQYIGNKRIITKEPKTKSSIRTLTISDTLIKQLRRYKVWQNQERLKVGADWVDKDRLFTQWNGEPMYPDTLTKWFNQFLKRHNLRHVTLHSVRHSNATLLIAEGTDIRTVSNRLGHAQTSTTLNIYTHALTSKDKQAADTLDDVLAIG